ncbi:hypothetical protein ACFFRT_01470 [Enterococcus thailandicus]|uniref:Transposase n=1 Tax=Enterococcus thailandicus TaxID=417368 RepID=A0A510W9I5_ENTTH|nr:hypothetical protein [Enterococcus thailandicus]GEK35883.1 hypothetical protein ETH01_01700 [Enterococcus thailandicus]GMC00967.1 hypothetical protein K2F_12260 [Enterococcus thailandicus]
MGGIESLIRFHLKEMAIQMKQNEIPVKTIMGELGIKNKTQIETWRRWLTFVFFRNVFL